MPSTLPSTPPGAAGARPVESSERVVLLDVLRGFALCGVFVSNAYMHLSGRILLPRASAEALTSSGVDEVAHFLYNHLLQEKAMSIFTFLFGLGFAIQLGRAEQRGASGTSVFMRRQGWLMLFGLTHLFALWYGDVLTLYAVTGLALLLFRKRGDRTLLVWGLVFTFSGPLLVPLQNFVQQSLTSPEAAQAAARETLEQVSAIKTRTLAGFESGSYLTTARANADFFLHVFFKPLKMLGFALVVLGRFLLGLLAGRLLIFHDVERHRPLFRRLLGGGLAVAVLGNGVWLLCKSLSHTGAFPERVWQVIQGSVWEVGVMGLAAFYVSGLSLLSLRARAWRWLLVLAPAGQMALTNYLSQTVISQFVFYGYGFNLIGKIHPAACLVLMFGLFWVQVLVSHLWLARLRFGPAEWIWRSLTYGKLQPLRRAPGPGGKGRVSAAQVLDAGSEHSDAHS